jgi:hypothetical protein
MAPPKPLERLVAGSLLLSLIVVWMAGLLVLPVTLINCLRGEYRLLGVVAVYYSFRSVSSLVARDSKGDLLNHRVR